MVLIVRSFLNRNPWMSTSCVRSVTRRRCRSGSFHVCMHPVGRYYREANVYFLKGVRRYPLGNLIFRENPEIIRGHSNFFPGSKKSRQPNLWRPSSLPLCDDGPFEFKKSKKKNGLPFLKWTEELIEPNWRRCFLTTRSHCILAWNWGWKGHKSPSHAHAVQLFSHCFLGFIGLQILHLSSPHEPQGMLLLQNRRGRIGKLQHRKWCKKVRKGPSFIVKYLLSVALRFKRMDALVLARLDILQSSFLPVSFHSAV